MWIVTIVKDSAGNCHIIVQVYLTSVMCTTEQRKLQQTEDRRRAASLSLNTSALLLVTVAKTGKLYPEAEGRRRPCDSYLSKLQQI